MCCDVPSSVVASTRGPALSSVPVTRSRRHAEQRSFLPNCLMAGRQCAVNASPAQCVGCGRPVSGDPIVCDLCACSWGVDNSDALAAVFYDRKGKPVLDVGEAIQLASMNRRIADDWLELGGQRVRVLTSFLVVEHGFDADDRPLVFETVVIGGPDHLWVTRYATEHGARAGHAIVLAIYGSGNTLHEERQS